MDRRTRPLVALLFSPVLLGPGPVLAADSLAAAADGPDAGTMMFHHHAGADGKTCPAMSADGSGDGASAGGWLATMDEFGLSAEQKQAVQALGERFRARAVDMRQRASGIREQLTSVPPEDPGYDAATAAAAAAAAELAAEGVRLASELRAQVHALLTPEQRQRLQERMSADRQRWDEWRSRHQAPQ